MPRVCPQRKDALSDSENLQYQEGAKSRHEIAVSPSNILLFSPHKYFEEPEKGEIFIFPAGNL